MTAVDKFASLNSFVLDTARSLRDSELVAASDVSIVWGIGTQPDTLLVTTDKGMFQVAIQEFTLTNRREQPK